MEGRLAVANGFPRWPSPTAAKSAKSSRSIVPNASFSKWRNEFKPELKSEGYSQCTIELEPIGEAVKLTITHEIDRPDSKFIEAVSGGWPRIVSNLKSLLETGEIVLKTKPTAG